MRCGCIALLLAVLSGCASTGEDYLDPRDPFEGYNRIMYRVNDTLDRGLVKPLARGGSGLVAGSSSTLAVRAGGAAIALAGVGFLVGIV